MSKFGSTIRKHLPANGQVAKTLTVVYVVWFYAFVNIIINVCSTNSHHHPISFKEDTIILVVSYLSWLIPSFISMLQQGAYAIILFRGGKRRRQTYVDKLDERQRQTRQRIFERSYTLLAALGLVGVFSSGQLAYITQNGIVLIGFNVIMLVISIPTLVAVFDKNIGTPDFDSEP